MRYYLHVIKNYAVFTGRGRRSEYWYFVLFNIIFAIVAMLIDRLIGDTFTMETSRGVLAEPFGYVYIIYALFVLIPGLAVGVRRLHDINKSGWFFFLALIPVIGSIWLLVWFCMDGTPGDNKYGPNPKETENNDEISQIGSYLAK